MKKRVKYLSLVFAAAICINLTACGGVSGETNNSISSENTVSSDNTSSDNTSSDNTDWPLYEIDAYDTVERDGEQIDVCVCHDREAIYLYYDDEKHELFDTAMLPTDEIYDKDWCLGEISLSDITGDNNSDLQVYLSHSDMSESYIVWTWEEGAGYVYQPYDSWFYDPIVIYDPLEDTVNDFSMYEGLWLSDEDNLYADTYLQFDAQGNWQLYSGGDAIDEGYLWYEPEEDVTYIYSYRGGAIDSGCIEVEGDRLNITTCGCFNYLDGRGGQWQGDGGGNWDGEDREDFNDSPEDTANYFSMYEGLWLSDEDNLYADTYLQFDAQGNWQLYSGGDAIDEGYLLYETEEGITYIYSYRGGAIDGGCIEVEGDRLNITTCGCFNYLDGRGGQWQGDGGGNWDGEDR